MAQDATGTPTALWGIPKYNTAVDPPSGKGFNAAMDFIDGIIIPDLLFDAKGDLVVASAADTAARLPVGTNGQVLTADSAQSTGVKWATAAGTIGYGTALPGSPADGDFFILVDSTTAPTYSWQLRYVAAKASNKWIFVGGSPLKTAEGALDPLTTSYQNVGSATGNIPVNGDYRVTIGGRVEASGSFPSDMAFITVNGAGITESDNDAVTAFVGSSVAQDNIWTGHRELFKALTSGSGVVCRARARSATNIRVSKVSATVLPIAIGG